MSQLWKVISIETHITVSGKNVSSVTLKYFILFIQETLSRLKIHYPAGEIFWNKLFEFLDGEVA
jgi:hypothetical protein